MGAEAEQKGTDIIVADAAVELTDAALALSEPSARDPEFLHAVLCQVGLPRSQIEGREFVRRSGSAMLMVEAGKWFDGLRMNEMFVPYGTRPRLVLVHLCSEAARCRSPEVEVENSASAFLQRLGIEKSGRSMAAFKRQMLALAACRMQLGYRTSDDRALNVKCDPIGKFEAWVQELPGQRPMWPGVVTLSSEFYETLIAHSVPLDANAIHSLQNSALALDVYTWLAHRLCRVRKEGGLPLYWKSLKEQFGQEYKVDKDFKREFLGAIRKAVGVYPDARVEKITGGLRLYPSPPPIRKRQVVAALPKPDAQVRDRAEDAAPAPLAPADVRRPIAISADAIEAVREIAPGYDKYWLEQKFIGWASGLKEPLKLPPDKAFLAWARKFTRGRRA